MNLLPGIASSTSWILKPQRAQDTIHNTGFSCVNVLIHILILMLNRYEKGFIWTTGMLLVITGILKILSVLMDNPSLQKSDHLFRLPYYYLFLMTGIIEIAIALYCFFGSRINTKLALIAWVCFAFVVYRLGLHWLGAVQPCGCMGALRQVLNWISQHQEDLAKAMLVYMMFGSGLFFMTRLVRTIRADGDNPKSQSISP